VTIPLLNLDTLRWDDLMRIARDRLIGVSEGNWTLHAPIDPGITILEALAAQLDQRLFLLDQVPDIVLWRSLGLLDVERLPGHRPSSTVLGVTAATTTVVEAGTSAELVVGGRRLRATTDHPVCAVADLRVAEIAVPRQSRRVDPSVEPMRLTHGDRLDLSIGLSAKSAFSTRGSWLGLYVELDGATDEAATGADDRARDDGRRAPVGWPVVSHHRSWWVVDGDRQAPLGPPVPLVWTIRARGTERAVEVLDGTDGFRRSGVVLVRQADTDWLPPDITVSVVSSEPWPSASLYLRWIAPNAVAARLRRAVRVDPGVPGPGVDIASQIRDWAGLPGAALDLSSLRDEGEILDPAATRFVLLEADGRWHRWRPIAELGLAAPGDRVFSVDPAMALVAFGDDRHGRVPRPCQRTSSRFVLRAEIAGIGAQAVGRSSLSGPSTGQWRVGAGGLDAMTLAALDGEQAAGDIRSVRTGASQRRRRVVTPDDAAQVVLDTPRVAIARAHPLPFHDVARPGRHVPDAITVFCVPPARTSTPCDLSVLPRPDGPSMAVLQRRLDECRLVGTRLFASPPVYRPIRLRLSVRGGDASMAALPEIETALRRNLHPTVGGPHGRGWPLGAALSPTSLLLAAQRAAPPLLDVTELTVEVLARDGCGGEPSVSSCEPVAIEPYELPALGEVVVDTAHG
jgi:hypothetical protein